jgi:hypothetical protein
MQQTQTELSRSGQRHTWDGVTVTLALAAAVAVVAILVLVFFPSLVV